VLVVEALPDLPITRVSRWCFNCYVITGDTEGLVVVDPGMPTIADDLAPLLTAPLTSIAATHGHPDHISGAPLLASRHGASIHVPATTLTYFDDTTPRTPSVAKLARTWPLLFGQPFDAKAVIGFARGTAIAGFGTSRGMRWRGPRPTHPLEDGAPLAGASAWTVINTPGHTDDSVAFWHNDSHTLLSGDAVITIRGAARFAPDTVDDVAAVKTAARLRSLPVEHLLPGHGIPIHALNVWATRT
jgi:glyoxylase-like metal-dependent hydrolase (beta-lactamase superfamily II)